MSILASIGSAMRYLGDIPKRSALFLSIEVGFFQIEEVLIQKINSSPVRPYISLYAGITGQEFKKYL